jgi:hypothetical protein
MKYREGNATERTFEAVFDFIDRRYITKRVMMLGTFALVIHVVEWMLRYAETSQRSGTEISAIFGAIGLPLSGLMGYMFAQYSQNTPPILSAPPAPAGGPGVNVTVTQ